MAKAETEILNRWRLKWAKWGVLFRQQVGTFYAGQLVGDIYFKTEKGREVAYGIIRNIQPTPMGIKGLADYIGWHEQIITQDMVGKKVAIFASVEGKSEDGQLRDEQVTFLKAVRRAGGIAFVVRDPETKPSGWEPHE